MAVNDNGAAATARATDDQKRFRSEIEFPYADLQSAVELAQTIHEKAGNSCDTDELAVWMNQSATGGTFRSRLNAGRTFGLIETAQGRATLTPLGRESLDNSGGERAARVAAFLNAPLFSAMYEQNKGNQLPPVPALERQIEQLGVSPKQKERARQIFQKSASYAGFIDPASGRFVKPGVPSRDDNARRDDPPDDRHGGGGGPNDPLIKALIQKMPTEGPWSADERVNWLKLLTMAFQMTYGQEPEIEVKKKEGVARG
jgi:hypothetical protein